MNDNQKKAAELLAKANQSVETKSEAKTEFYRKKKAQEMVQGYKMVMLDKTEFIEEGNDPSDYTAAVAEARLIAKWEDKAEAKESEAI